MLTQVLATAQEHSDGGMNWPWAAVMLGFLAFIAFVCWLI